MGLGQASRVRRSSEIIIVKVNKRIHSRRENDARTVSAHRLVASPSVALPLVAVSRRRLDDFSFSRKYPQSRTRGTASSGRYHYQRDPRGSIRLCEASMSIWQPIIMAVKQETLSRYNTYERTVHDPQ